MSVTVQQSIPQHARGLFLRERDALNEHFGVRLKFPQGKEFMFGTTQTMLMVGKRTKINEMRSQVKRILFEADQQYYEYKERRAYRKEQYSNKRYQEKWVNVNPNNVILKKVKSKSKNPSNAFSVLEGLFEQEQEQIKVKKVIQEQERKKIEMIKAKLQLEQDAIDSGLAPKSVKKKICVMDYRAAIKKPAKPKENVEDTTNPTNVSLSCADEQSDEEFEDDNGWDSNMSWGDMC